MSAWDVIRHEFEDPHIQAFLLWQAYQTLVPVDVRRLRAARVLARVRPPAAVVDDPARRLGRADRRARALHRATTAARVLCGKRVTRLLLDGGRCTGRRDRGRRALHGARGGRLDDPRQAPARDGAGRRCGTRASATASRRSTSACRRWPSTWRRPRRRCSRRRTGRAARCRPGSPAFPQRRDRVRPRAARRPLRRGPGVAAGRLPDARRSLARARRATTRSSSSRAQSYGFPERKDAQADRQLERVQRGRARLHATT